MAEPITWKNITGGDIRPALAAFDAAQGSFKDSIGSLEKMFLDAQQQATDKENRVLDGQEAQYRFLADSIKTADEFERRRPELDAALALLPEARRAKLLTVDDDLRRNIYGTEKEVLGREDMLRVRAEAPLFDSTAAYILSSKDYAGSRQKVAALGDNFYRKAELNKMIDDRERQSRIDKENGEDRALSRANQAAQLRATQRAEKEAEEQRSWDNAVATRVQEHRTRQQLVGEQYGDFAKKNDFKSLVGPNGRVDTDLIRKLSNLGEADLKKLLKESPAGYAETRDQLAAFNKFKDKAQKAGLPSLENLLVSDSQVGDLAVRDLERSGQYAAATVERNRAGARALFYANGDPLVGDEKRRADRQEAERQVNLTRDLAEGWTLPGSPRARAMGDLLTDDKLLSRINAADGNSPEEDLPGVRNAIAAVVNQGIVVNGQRVVPSESLIKQALNSAPGSWWADGNGSYINGRDKAFIALLTKLANTPEMRKQAAKAAENDKAAREAEFKAALRGANK